jgi:hypothetical protein
LNEGYDSDVEDELGAKKAGRRELINVADGHGEGLADQPWRGAIFVPTKWYFILVVLFCVCLCV